MNSCKIKKKKNPFDQGFKTMLGNVATAAFSKILIFFFTKIEYGLYVLDRFDVLMSKMILKKIKKTSLTCILTRKVI